MNLYEAKTPLLGEGGVAAPSRKMARRHLVWRGRGGSFKRPLESIRRLNEPPRLRPAKVASRHFGWAQPPLLRQGGEFRLILFSSFAANCPARSGSLTFR